MNTSIELHPLDMEETIVSPNSFEPIENSLLSHFGFNPAEFKNLLAKTGCFIAGGAVTHLLRDGDPTKFDGDLDIWYPYAPSRESVDSEKIQKYVAAETLLYDTMVSHCYRMIRKPDGFTAEYTDKENHLNLQILKVLSFEVMDRRVQIIFATGSPTEILHSFDYSFCANMMNSEGQYMGVDMSLTRDGLGYALNPSRNVERDTMRREKYRMRGFTIIDRAVV